VNWASCECLGLRCCAVLSTQHGNQQYNTMKIFVSHTVVDCEVEPEAWVAAGLVEVGGVLVICRTWQQVRCL